MRAPTPLALLLALAAPAQDPAPTARLEGRVVDCQQRPVPGALVTAEADGEPLGRTASDAQGTFVFGRLPRRIVTVRATTRAPDAGGNWVDLFGIDRGCVAIVLLPARRVTGTVRDAEGRPLAGAWIGAAPNDLLECAHAACTAHSDADGRYLLGHVPIGPATVRIWAPGCDAASTDVDGSADATFDATLRRDDEYEQRFVLADATPAQAAAATLRVRALHNGLPFPLPAPLRRPTAEAAGRWLVAGWPADDEVRASVTVPDVFVTPLQHVIAAGVGRTTRRFHAADPDFVITGKLTAPDDLAVGGRTVLVQPHGSAVDDGSRVVVTTAPDGTFRAPSPVMRDQLFALRIADGRAVVDRTDPVGLFLARQQNRPLSADRAWYLGGHPDPQGHTVRIRPAHAVQLTVVARDGTPLFGASVALFEARDGTAAVRGLATPMAARGLPLGFGTSDVDGRVTIAGLDLTAGEALAAVAWHADGCGEATFGPGDSPAIDLGKVPLGPAAAIAGLCVDEQGKPAPGRRVFVQPQRSWYPAARRAVADRDGRFVIAGLFPGHHLIATLDPRTGDPTTFQQVVLSEPVTEVTLR